LDETVDDVAVSIWASVRIEHGSVGSSTSGAGSLAEHPSGAPSDATLSPDVAETTTVYAGTEPKFVQPSVPALKSAASKVISHEGIVCPSKLPGYSRQEAVTLSASVTKLATASAC